MLQDVLAKKKAAILEKWLEVTAKSHPAGPNFFQNKDRFTNPVAYTVSKNLDDIYDQIIEAKPDLDRLSAPLEDILKIRAIQEIPPSQAISFIFSLKKIIREECGLKQNQPSQGLEFFDSRIDDIALLAFDLYTRCREAVNRIRIDEIKLSRDNAMRMLERASAKSGENGRRQNMCEVTE